MPVAAVLTRNDGNAPPANGRVRQWLSRAGLGEYRDAFARASEREFTELGMVDFQKFGVVNVAHKQTLFGLIKNLRAEGVARDTLDAHPSSSPVHAALLDVHAAEHEAFTLSPASRPGASTPKSPFASTPADDPKDAKDAKDAKPPEPPERLRRLSRERHDAAERPAAIAGETFCVSRSLEDAPANAPTTTSDPGDPAKTPFVAPRAAQAETAARVSSAPLASLPAEQPRIRVVVRKRPLNAKERARSEEDVVTVDRRAAERAAGPAASSPSSVTVREPKTKVDLTRYTEEHAFAFDDAFPPEVDNDEVYRTTVAPLVGTVFEKCKVTCFAYGQTGSGKTYTMNPLPTRAAREILGELARRAASATTVERLRLHVSFFEIYGGRVYDLLNGRAKLVIREDARAQMCVVGLKEFEVADVGLVEQLIAHGTAARCVGSTGANAESSRSHAIMQFVLKRAAEPSSGASETRRVPASAVARRLRNAAGANHETIHGKFSFIDLAGSERGADTSENDRQTRLEGAEINKSLLALKECIRALDRGTGHVPFRGSKLTEVLRDSFMGNSRTVMIANVSPATGSCEHTLNTLRYAYRVKELRDGEKPASDRPGAEGERRERAAPRGARLGPDGVTPVGPPPDASSRGETSGGGDNSESADAERLAETKRGAAAAALLSPRGRRERPRSAMPGGAGGARAGAKRVGGADASGSPTKDASARSVAAAGAPPTRRPQTARPRARMDPFSGARAGVSDPRVTAFDLGGSGRGAKPAAGKTKAARRKDAPTKEAPRVAASGVVGASEPAAARRAETASTPSAAVSAEPSSGTRPLRGSALAAAKAHAHMTGAGPPVPHEEMARAHDALINVILEEEEAVIAAHRAQIENAMALVKREMALLAEVDKPGSAIDVYVERLAQVLDQKRASIEALCERVRAFQTHLKEEEVLSKAVGLQ